MPLLLIRRTFADFNAAAAHDARRISESRAQRLINPRTKPSVNTATIGQRLQARNHAATIAETTIRENATFGPSQRASAR